MENENNESELRNNEQLKNLIETTFKEGGRPAKPPHNGGIVIATQDIGTDYAELIKNCGGKCITLGTGKGHTFNPFNDATEEQIEAFITAYCASYPEELRGIVREKVVKEIEGIKKQGRV